MGLGEPNVKRQHACLGTEAQHRQEKGRRPPEGRQQLSPHVVEGVVPGVGLEDAKGQENGDGADVGDKKIEESRLPDFRHAVVGGHQEKGGEGHGLPGHHEGVGVVGQHHQGHAGEEEMVLQAQETGRRTLPLAEIAGGEHRNPGTGGTDDGQEESRQAVETQMERKLGQTEGQDGRFRRTQQGRSRRPGENESDGTAEGKQPPGHQGEIAQGCNPRQAN